jgi:hypothetical protein
MIMGLGSELILIEVDHDLMIMKEGVGWPTTDTCRR